MSSTSLGTKRHCQSCGKNFYDLEKLPIVCPLCSTVFDPEVLLKSSRVKATSQAPVKKVDTSATSDDEDLDDDLDVEDDDLNDDDDMLDDDSDIVSIAGSDMKDDDEEIEVSADDALDDDLDDQDDD